MGGAMSGRKAFGGKTLYGARVGILMMETRFPRVPGDIGNALTWPFPVLYKVVRGAVHESVIVNKAQDLLDAYVAAAHELVRDGADGIATSCGYLSLIQEELRARVSVPVAASSLMQVPLVQRLLPQGKRVGIITETASLLTVEHLEAAGAPVDTPVVGCEGGRAFTPTFVEDRMEFDLAAAERDLLEAGDEMVQSHPDVGAVVLETTNMVPFSRAMSEHIRRPVFDIYTFVCWFHAGLVPRDFGWPASASREWRER